MRKLLLAFCAVTTSITVIAQDKKVRFQSSGSVGLMGGESLADLQLNLVNGVRYKTWGVGLGLGIDYYHTRTVPVFFEVRKALSTKPNNLFLYTDVGSNKPWLTRMDKMARSVINSTGGLYYDAGVGYQHTAFKKHAFFVSVGYSGKSLGIDQLRWNYFVDDFWRIAPTDGENVNHYKYRLQRISLKLGVRF